MPIKIYIQNIKEAVAPLFVPIASDRIEKVGDNNVATHDWVHCPFGTKESDTFGRAAKDILAFDENRASFGGKTLACKDLEEGRLSG